MDVRDMQRAIGGVVLESAYLERVLRTAFSALTGSKYAAVVSSRLMASALIEDCRRVAEVHSGIGAPERAALILSLHHCESANHARNRVIHDNWAPRPGNVKVTLQSGRSSHEVTVTSEAVSELIELAERIGNAADDLSAAVLAALGPASLLIEDQLREELGHDSPFGSRQLGEGPECSGESGGSGRHARSAPVAAVPADRGEPLARRGSDLARR